MLNITKIFTITVLALFTQLAAAPDSWAFGKAPTQPPANPKPPVEEEEPVPSTGVIRARWEASQRDGAAWSQHVYNRLTTLGPNLINQNPADISTFCANYRNLTLNDRKNFWVYLISSMSELESSHRPATTYTEAFNDSQGRPVISRGLLQISIESANSYGCGITDAQQLHDPKINLDCGIRILNRWLGRDGRLAGKSGSTWQGGARYWAVLRKDNHLAKITGWTQAQRICFN